MQEENIQDKISKRITDILTSITSKVEVMAVVKYASKDDIISLLKDGRIKIIGENKIQDAISRWVEDIQISKLRSNIELHFIGHLQKNKVKYAVKLFDSIDSIDSFEIAKEIDLKAEKLSKKIPVALQVKINNSKTQYGILPEEFDRVFNEISKLKNISIRGIMAIGPITNREDELSGAFKIAKNIYDRYFSSQFNKDGFKNILSMGMSSDWKIAIKEGSNLIRIGSFLFN